MTVTQIGVVRSDLKSRTGAPRQSWMSGAPPAAIEIDPDFLECLEGLQPGQDIWLLTWLHQSDRETRKVRPGHDPNNPVQGVFATRSPDRPTPIGLHRVRIMSLPASGELLLHVDGLEAIDGTPVIDIKPVIDPSGCF